MSIYESFELGGISYGFWAAGCWCCTLVEKTDMQNANRDDHEWEDQTDLVTMLGLVKVMLDPDAEEAGKVQGTSPLIGAQGLMIH